MNRRRPGRLLDLRKRLHVSVKFGSRGSCTFSLLKSMHCSAYALMEKRIALV